MRQGAEQARTGSFQFSRITADKPADGFFRIHQTRTDGFAKDGEPCRHKIVYILFGPFGRLRLVP